MSASTGTQRFRQGAGRLCLDFVRTLRYRGTAESAEELPDATAVAAWIRQCAPHQVDSDVTASAAQAEDARNLREAIHELIETARGPRGPGSCGAPARDRVNQAASLPMPTPRLDTSGRVNWHTEDPVSATFALLARDTLDLVASAAIGRVRKCANPACGALFRDSSRPGTRRWCSMGTCGNRAKKKTLRDKAGSG